MLDNGHDKVETHNDLQGSSDEECCSDSAGSWEVELIAEGWGEPEVVNIPESEVVRPDCWLAGLTLGQQSLPHVAGHVISTLIPLILVTGLGRQQGGALGLEQVLVLDHGGLPVDGLVSHSLVTKNGDAAPTPMVHLNQGSYSMFGPHFLPEYMTTS